MNKKLVIEVHVGKRYGISRLNCDGAGQVKDVLIDNSRYNRISSQSKKRVWREHLEECLGEMEHVYVGFFGNQGHPDEKIRRHGCSAVS